MSEMRADIERAVDRLAGIIADAVTQSGMTKDDVEDLKEALRQLVVVTKR